jgi:peptide/nickel transport system ATP-binding protein
MRVEQESRPVKNDTAADGETVIAVEHVSKHYSSGLLSKTVTRAVEDVSFVMRRGRILSLIGESGSGKTTMGKLILKLIEPTDGCIRFCDDDISCYSSRREKQRYYRKVQAVFQEPFASFNPLYKVDRVFEMVFRSLIPEENDREEKVAAALRSVNLEPGEVLGKYPHQLSGGQLQRILIARALVLDAEVLIADELISMLDASTRIGVLNLLGRLARERGLTVLFITHDLSLGYYISDESLIMYRGRLVEMGDTRKVYHQAAHPYTKLLLRSVPDIGTRWDPEERFVPETITDTVSHFYRQHADTAPGLQEIEPGHWVMLNPGQ